MIAPLPAAAIPDAVALWAAVGLTRPWNDAQADARRALDGATSTILAASVAGRLAGTVMVGHDGHRGWVYYLAVAPDQRRAGLGRALMAAAMAWLRSAGVPRLNLMVRDGNEAVLGFYAALGFRRAEVQVLQHDL